MKKTAPPSAKSVSAIPPADIPRYRDSWLLVGDINRHSPRTIEAGGRWPFSKRFACGLPTGRVLSG